MRKTGRVREGKRHGEKRKKRSKTPEKNVSFIPEKKYRSKKAQVAFPVSVDTLTPTHKGENVPKFQSQSHENWIKKTESTVSRK